MPDKQDFDRDSISNTLIVAVGLSLVCSIIVASAAIILKPIQEKNEEEFRQKIILDVAGLMEPGGNIAELFNAIEPRMVELVSAITQRTLTLHRSMRSLPPATRISVSRFLTSWILQASVDAPGLRLSTWYAMAIASSNLSCLSTAKGFGRRCSATCPLHRMAQRSKACASMPTQRHRDSVTRSTRSRGARSGSASRSSATATSRVIRVIKGACVQAGSAGR